ncbi:methyltransferase domain-containing protein [Streptomyces mirabilis]|uniref:methyltransferase domain-containing protein n=1 Tax=Streptomyces mirabilis TaxID=68239 RepID=UPI0036585B83
MQSATSPHLISPDGHFDGVRCERVLQHVREPDAAIKELIRVTRPGGRVCVIDTDWSSSVADGFDHLDEDIAEFFPEDNDLAAGRAIRSRMVRAGLRHTTALPVALRFTSLTDAGVVVPFFNRGAMQSRVRAELIERFFASDERSVDRGGFLSPSLCGLAWDRSPSGQCHVA